jgi:hypothetical protein
MRLSHLAMYGLAVLLVAATVPMYGYMLRRSSVDLREPVSVPHASAVSRVRVEPASRPYYYRYGEPLPRGYQCSGADGLVYRMREVNGSVMIDQLVRDGQLVHCEGTSDR